MMVDFLGAPKASRALMDAIEAVTADGQFLTRDLGGRSTTREFTDAVLEKLAKPRT